MALENNPAGLASAAGLHCKRACQTMTITVEHHSDGLTTSFPCHFQRFHGEPAVRRERHGPAQWFSCEQVENNGEVRPALIRPDIGHITTPHLIWPGHGELPFNFVCPPAAVLISAPSCSPDGYRPSPLPLAAVACACASLIIIGFGCPNHG